MIESASNPAGGLPQQERTGSPLEDTFQRAALESRILLLAPNGRDTQRIVAALSGTQMHALVCGRSEILLAELQRGAAAAIVAQESLSPSALNAVSEWVRQQSQWSDLPFIVITCGGAPNPAVVNEARDIEQLGNVTLLDRPLRADTIRSCVRVALRARNRQYETRRYLENLSLAMRDLEQFAYSASHDLREPLRTVGIYSELLETRYSETLNDAGRLYLGYVRSASRRMEMLVRDLLAYSQAAGFDEARAPLVQADEPLRSALTSLREAIEQSRAILTYDALPAVHAKAVHLRQLFQNLIANAIKYRRDERARIHISASRQDHFWRFSVADNGIGIEPRFQEQIFGIFKRLHTSDKFAGAGTGANTGIGLAICQKIIERYGGRIWVESAVDAGSTFYFTLPE